MKRNTIKGLIIFLLALCAPRTTQAQGTTYLSNLGQNSDGSIAIGSDSWLAAGFSTGNNIGGYSLNSVQLAMTVASGNPSGFTVTLYAMSSNPSAVLPGSSLGTLNGASNPVNGGIYNYIPTSSLTLLPRTDYFIVITAGTTVANGAYDWSYTDTSVYNPGDAWVLSISLNSENGSHWNFISGTYSQFAIMATPVPEPSSTWLLWLGGGIFFYVRKLRST